MKKLVMIFMMASLLVTTALSLGSCKKTDANENANTKKFFPTVYDYIIFDEDQNSSKEDVWMDCYYCTQNFPPQYPDNRLYKCNHNPSYVDDAFYCSEHSHIHYFEATDDCTPIGRTNPYFCEYRGSRKHRHILIYTSHYYFKGWHIGGGAGNE